VHERSLQFTVYSQQWEKKNVERPGKRLNEDFNTEGTEEEGEESVRDGARAAGRWIEAAG
jgi:hypothetical protein